MTMQKLRVGIAGYGVVGKRRRQFIDLNPNFVTVAVSDVNFGHKGAAPDGVRYYPAYQDLFREELDVLFVSLPNYLAAEATIEGLRRGIHVFCEKPPGRTLEDVRNVMIAEESQPGIKLKYGFNHRYHDSVRDAMKIIRSKELGEIINVRAVYGKSKIIPFSGGWRAERQFAGGGILLDQGIHMVDLIMLFCGAPVEVKSFVTNSFWRHDVEDNAYALLKDGDGRIAMLHSSATQWQHRFVFEITLENGFLELRGILSGSKSYGEEQLITGRRDESDTGTLRYEIIKYLEDNSWRDEINEFAEAVLKNVPIKNGTSKDAFNTMKLVYRIYYSDENWRETYNIESPE